MWLNERQFERARDQVVHQESWTVSDLPRIIAFMGADQQMVLLNELAGCMSDPSFNIHAIQTLYENLEDNAPDYVPEMLERLGLQNAAAEGDGMTELEKCYAVYQEGGMDAIIDHIKENHPHAPRHFCVRCNDNQPFDPESEICLLCGTAKSEETN